ncbi:MAG: hypothetical protein VYE68_10985 [Acidobacteriota bacterium]|nr:hypothetical protein [Acidobacteriota bacterium]
MPLRLTATVCLLLLLPGDVQANDVHELVGRGYELAYNLDHDEAVDTFEAAIVRYPDHPAPHRGLAAAAWTRLLFLRGTMTVDDYLGSVTPRQVEMPDPPRALADTFETHSERATETGTMLTRTTSSAHQSRWLPPIWPRSRARVSRRFDRPNVPTQRSRGSCNSSSGATL